MPEVCSFETQDSNAVGSAAWPYLTLTLVTAARGLRFVFVRALAADLSVVYVPSLDVAGESVIIDVTTAATIP